MAPWRRHRSARGIARFLILDGQFPRSLVFCYDKIRSNMAGLASQYAKQTLAHELLRSEGARLHGSTIESIFEHGLYEFLERFIVGTVAIGNRIAADYQFVG